MHCPNCDNIVTAEAGSSAGLYDDGYPPEVYCASCGWPDNIEGDQENSTTMEEACRMYSEWLEGMRTSHY